MGHIPPALLSTHDQAYPHSPAFTYLTSLIFDIDFPENRRFLTIGLIQLKFLDIRSRDIEKINHIIENQNFKSFSDLQSACP